MEDSNLELNLVSAPAVAPTTSSHRRKAISRYAWDKKNRKKRAEERRKVSHSPLKSPASGQEAPSPGARNKPRQAAQNVGDAHPAVDLDAVHEKGELPAKDGKRQNQTSLASSAAAGGGGDPHHVVDFKEQADAVANDASPPVRRNHVAAPVSPDTQQNGRGEGLTITSGPRKPQKTAPQHVRHEVGQQDKTPGSRGVGEQRQGRTKRSPAVLPSEESGAKRKRPKKSTGFLVRDGVVDFTDENKDATPKTGKLSRVSKHRAPAGRVASSAVVSAANKWWEDGGDDDDVKVVPPRFKGTQSASAAGGSALPGRPGSGVVVDEDGGLPSDVHPNSVRPKRVDMDGEASNAMGILAALLGKGDAARSQDVGRVKNRGNDAKISTESATGNGAKIEGDVDSALTASGATYRASFGSKKEGDGQTTNFETPVSDGAQEKGKPARTVSDGGSNSIDEVVTRKNRGKLELSHKDASGGGVPPPEHHARPRELSRRAAAKPLRSTRSAHIMAAGPGATFAALGIPPKMVCHLEGPKGESGGGGGMELAGPTVCQVAAIPVLSAGHNAVIKSETGSGKTLAYLLPMLCDLAALEPRVEREKGTFAIVLAPTRELSAQILEVLTRVVSPFIWLVPGSLSGGERRKSEKARLRRGVAILVCTPGRLLDHLKATKCFRRELLRWLVLDEADRLLDMGFEKQVKEIIELLDQSARAVRSGPAGGSRVKAGEVAPSVKVIRRQTVLVSATLDKGVSRLATILLSKYLRVDADKNFVESVDESGSVKHVSGVRETPEMKTGSAKQTAAQGAVLSTNGSTEGEVNAAASVEEFSIPRQLVQYYMNVTQKLRLPALCAFLRAHAGEKVVAFMSTCDAVDFHYDMFRRAVWPGGARPALSAPTAVGGKENGGSDDSQNKGTGDDENGKRKDSETSRAADSEFFGTGCRVKRLHGNVPQSERQATYRAFGASTSGVLICTDVAARGLDLPTVDWIVQYDPPAETADYVHRVGRTARKGERGHSLLFLLPRETAYLGVLEARGLRPKPLSLEGVLCAADAGKHDARRADEQLAYELQQDLQLLVAGDKILLDRARAAFQSHVRAYAARAPDSRAVFQVRSLHLGHVARSFALKDPPTAVKVGKRVVRRSGDGRSGSRDSAKGSQGRVDSARVEKRRRDGAGGMGGSVRRLGLSKRTEAASRSEFL